MPGEPATRWRPLRRLVRLWGLRTLDELTVDTALLSSGHRTLAICGYVAIVGLLVAILAASSIPEPRTAFVDVNGRHDTPTHLVPVFLATQIAGWAFVLTGASDAGRRMFLLLLVLCVFELSSIASDRSVLPPVAVLIAGSIAVLQGPTNLWVRHPVGEFTFWVVLLSLAALGSTAAIDSQTGVGEQFRFAGFVALVAFPFWIRLGREAASSGIDVGRSAASFVGRVVPVRLFLVVAAILTLCLPVVLGLVGPQTQKVDRALGGWLAFTLLMSFPVSLWCLMSVADGRWDVRAATLGLSLNVGFSLIALSLVSAMYDTGIIERLVGSLGLVPPLFLFVLLAAYDVVSFGVRQAEREGRLIPRTARVPLYVGMVILILGSVTLLQATTTIDRLGKSVSSNLLPSGAFLIGLAFLGLPAYVRAMRRNPERFVSIPLVDGLPAYGSVALGRPSRRSQALWFLVVGWWIWPIVISVATMLGISIIGLPWARRILARLPTLVLLRGRRDGAETRRASA